MQNSMRKTFASVNKERVDRGDGDTGIRGAGAGDGGKGGGGRGKKGGGRGERGRG